MRNPNQRQYSIVSNNRKVFRSVRLASVSSRSRPSLISLLMSSIGISTVRGFSPPRTCRGWSQSSAKAPKMSSYLRVTANSPTDSPRRRILMSKLRATPLRSCGRSTKMCWWCWGIRRRPWMLPSRSCRSISASKKKTTLRSRKRSDYSFNCASRRVHIWFYITPSRQCPQN